MATMRMPRGIYVTQNVYLYSADVEKAKEAIIYSYNRHINGFAALLEEEEAADIAKNSNVVSVFLSKEHKLHTTRSWEFLGLNRNGRNSAWQKGRFGQNTIIGNIDTGVWPESQSFSDKGYGPVPSKWRGRNVCQINKVPGSRRNPCNRFFFFFPLLPFACLRRFKKG
ncbi:serine-type endopeptidase [Spatholobus suberectus]|nr:serine-type endopeptidase [Spatholobus suberectus]